MPYDIEKVKAALKKKMSNTKQDPNEFRAPKVKAEEKMTFRFYILPPFDIGDELAGGIVAEKGMDDVFCIKHGSHWVNKRPLACPRTNLDEPCAMCDTGFDYLKDLPKSESNKEARAQVVKAWLSQQSFMVNIYFPRIESNPETLRGKVLFFNAMKTCYDQWDATINRKDGGDVADPQAYGVFYDPHNAYLYQLEITHQNGFNNYKTSKFLVAGLGSHPIAALKDKGPNEDRIKQILAMRHYLWNYISQPDSEALTKITEQMLHGASGVDPTKPAVAKSTPARPASKPSAKPAPVTEAATSDDLDVLDQLPGLDGEVEDQGEVPAPKTKAPAKPATAKTTPKPAAPTKPAAKTPPKKEVSPVHEVEESDDIDALLSQLTPTVETETE